jgi:hypothetical protein
MAPPETDIRIEQLREKIRATAAAADRLADEAFGASGGAGGTSESRARAADEATQEAQALVALVALLRDLLPEELRQQVADLVRQELMLVRAVIDWYLQRLEAGRAGPHSVPAREPVVQDIPLD